MIARTQILQAIPAGLRTPLLQEFDSILQNYLEGRWSPAELSGGHFCEIVYTILEGHASGKYATKPSKPSNFVSACKLLEANRSVPRSFQILIPRLLPALYEIRNNRGVGHAGGDVDPNYMDSTAVVGIVKWIVAELIRVLHGVSTQDAQVSVDALTEIAIPEIWSQGEIRRVLDPNLSIIEQVLLLLATYGSVVELEKLEQWIEPENPAYLTRTIRRLHKERMLELNESKKNVRILPPGAKRVSEAIKRVRNPKKKK